MFKEVAKWVKNELEDQKKYYHSKGEYKVEGRRQRMMELFDKALVDG